jgi:hypothetical protein
LGIDFVSFGVDLGKLFKLRLVDVGSLTFGKVAAIYCATTEARHGSACGVNGR